MDKHRLAIPPVAAIPGMLSYVGIDNDAMRGRISKSQGFVRLDVSKDLPAPRSARDILVHRAIHAGHDGAHCAHVTVRTVIEFRSLTIAGAPAANLLCA
jgi:hypothetical protein